MPSNILSFWQSMVESPRQMGAVLPSSRRLGQAIAREVMSCQPGHVIELGAGTGAITRALFELRGEFESFHVIEQAHRLAEGLGRQFPGLSVRADCASNLDAIHAGPVDRVTIVSSLPFRSLRTADRLRILQSLRRQHAKCRLLRFIQYSYGGRVPFRGQGEQLEWSRRQTVWANIPPATVWVLAQRPAAGG